MPVPYFVTPREFGLTHPNLSEVLDEVESLIATAESGVPTQTWVRILNAVSERGDLSDRVVERIIGLASDETTLQRLPQLFAVHVSLITNPALRDNPQAQGLFTSLIVPLVLDHPDVREFADSILRHMPGPRLSQIPSEPEYRAQIRAALGEEIIDDYFARTCALDQPDLLRTNAHHPLLTANGFARICEAVETLIASGDREQMDFAGLVFYSLCDRSDLTDEQAMALYRLGSIIARVDRAQGRWVFARLITNPYAPSGPSARLVSHRARDIRNMVLTQQHIRPETVTAALRAHIPYAVMRLQAIVVGQGARTRMVKIPQDALDVFFGDLAAGVARKRDITAENVHSWVKEVLTYLPSRYVWEHALTAFDRIAGAPGSPADPVRAFYDLAVNSTGGLGLFSGGVQTVIREEFLVWASGHEDARLRALAVSDLYLTGQVRAAAADESPLVRTAVAQHPLVAADVLDVLATDPDAGVRATVAERFLAALA